MKPVFPVEGGNEEKKVCVYKTNRTWYNQQEGDAMDTPAKRKQIRMEQFDYATPGAYFITICTRNRENLFWESVGADAIRPEDVV